VVCLVAGILQARDVEVISITTVNPDEMDRKKAEIEKLLSDGSLSAADKAALEKLRTDAARVAALNQECGSVSLTSVPNPKCNTFYREELPAFESSFGTITGNLYLNKLGLVTGLKNRQNQIEACVGAMSAFLNPGFLPKNLVAPKVQRSLLEPLDDVNAEFSMLFQVGVNNARIVTTSDLATRWIGICGEVVHHPVEPKFAPYFLRKLQPFASANGFALGGDDTSIVFHVPGKWKYRYHLNKDELAVGDVTDLIEPDASLLRLHYHGGVVTHVTMPQNPSIKDYAVKHVIPISEEDGVKVVWSVVNDAPENVTVPPAPIVDVAPIAAIAPSVDTVSKQPSAPPPPPEPVASASLSAEKVVAPPEPIQATPPPVGTKSNESPAKRSRSYLVPALIAGGAVVVGGAAWMVLGKQASTSTSSNPPSAGPWTATVEW